MRISWTVMTVTLVISVSPTDGGFWSALMNELIGEEDDDVLDPDDWRDKNDTVLMKARNNSDCSYVQQTLNTDYRRGFLDIVASPELIYNTVGMLMGQYVRIIFSVCYRPGDVIRLYLDSGSSNATSSSLQLLDEIEIPQAYLDHVDSQVFYDRQQSYLAEYARKNKSVVLVKKYHRYQPNWMWCMRDMLAGRRVDRLFLPGTHDSGSYTSPTWWRNKFYITSLYYQYVFTQEDSIYNQLMQGARILDLRIAKHNSSVKFFVNHGKFKVHPLSVILDQIIQFIKDCPHEIVVMDVHEMSEGFVTREDFDDLAQYLKNHLGRLIIENRGIPTWNITLQQIWKTDARIFIGFSNYPSSVRNHFHPEIDQIWGRKDKLEEFVAFMNDTLPQRCNDSVYWLSSAMVELTPIGLNLLRNTYGGLRRLASKTNSVVTTQFAIGQWGVATQAASVDYLASSGIVTAAIIQNTARLREGHPCH